MMHYMCSTCQDDDDLCDCFIDDDDMEDPLEDEAWVVFNNWQDGNKHVFPSRDIRGLWPTVDDSYPLELLDVADIISPKTYHWREDMELLPGEHEHKLQQIVDTFRDYRRMARCQTNR